MWRESEWFLPGRSTADVIGMVRRLFDSSVEYSTSLYAKLIDFSKAFDRVRRCAIRACLVNFGIDHRLVDRIMDLLTETTVSVKIGDFESRVASVYDGVR